MSREIVFPQEELRPRSGTYIDQSTELKPDYYLGRLIKYIPGESIVLYQSLSNMLATSERSGTNLHWAILVTVGIGNVLYLRKGVKIQRRSQIAVSTVAFVVWTVALGEPFLSIPGWDPIYGAILLPLFTFFVPLYTPPAAKQKRSALEQHVDKETPSRRRR